MRIPVIILSLLMLAGCASTRQIEISASPIEKPPLVVPKVTKLRMRDVKWMVVNKDNAAQVLADLDKKDQNVVLFALTDKGYDKLYGARPMARLIQEKVKKPLAEELPEQKRGVRRADARQMRMEDPVEAGPAAEAPRHRVPGAEPLGQIAPAAARAHAVYHRVDELPVVTASAPAGTWTAQRVRFNQFPFSLG